MKSSYVWALAALAAAVPLLQAQTSIDLRTQAKSVDFSSALSTKPSKMGTSLPLLCSVGETFFKTDALAGRNFYGCTSANSWTMLASNLWFGGGSVAVDDCAKFDANGG